MLTSVIFPTRRKERCKEAMDSMFATAEGDIELFVGQNPDCLFDTPGTKYVSEAGPCARAFEMAKMTTGEILFPGTDDFIWRTQGWDRMFHELAQKHPIACFYFNDGRVNMDSCIPVVTRKFYEIAGYIPNHFYHYYGDTWVAKIAEAAGCLVYAKNIVIEHMHPKFRKAERDPVYGMHGRIETDIWDRTKPERESLVEKLKAHIHKPQDINPVTKAYLDKRV